MTLELMLVNGDSDYLLMIQYIVLYVLYVIYLIFNNLRKTDDYSIVTEEETKFDRSGQVHG